MLAESVVFQGGTFGVNRLFRVDYSNDSYANPGKTSYKTSYIGADVNILGSPYFLQFGVPLITVSLSVFIKFVIRDDKHRGLKKEDVAIGLELALVAFLIFITNSVQWVQAIGADNATQEVIDKVASVPWVTLAFIVGIWGISTLVRKLAWGSDDKLKIFWGIIVPDIFGLLTLLFVVSWIV